ncbi:SubName: Full=Uncharacterized protein {ECO:0000313/EMBL:CCA74187.1} [Serendipita indica DSM 11827]|uniref:DUF6533 domain-containing protein n=1 Tax=Serendipita indica (strain DSM 11827) TaxID=1109443 RepID=G4TS94_SERID|nr:SubName: Full=Uncharacterized protein {ECO:0000313/EMBL:CCA74187.1} [Serendipita indica DSM 11827]CCA74187.1 hypothetical protein PIIN_08140 [Serendipita indica DSM 11827]
MVAFDGGSAWAATSMLEKTFTIADLLQIAYNLRISTYFTAASGVLLLYDYLLTLPGEIEHVWSAKLSLPTVLFYVNRYVPMPVLLLGVFHVSPFHAPQSLLLFLSYSSSWLLLLRVVALYQGQVILQCILYAAFVLSHTSALVFVVSGLVPNWDAVFYSKILKICSFDDVKYFAGVYFSLIPFEFLLVALQINHLIRHQHLLRPQAATATTQTRAAASLPHLLRTIYFDGSLYFLVVVALRLSAGFIVAYMGPSLWYMASWTEYSLSSLMVSRLFLHLRQVAARNPETLPVTTMATHNESESKTRFSSDGATMHESHDGKSRAPLSTIISVPLSAIPEDVQPVGELSRFTMRSFENGADKFAPRALASPQTPDPTYKTADLTPWKEKKPLPPLPPF